MLNQKKAQGRAPAGRSRPYDRITAFFADRSVWIPTVMCVAIVLLLAATIVVAIQVSCLRDRVASAEAKLAALAEDTAGLRNGWVKSSFVDVQPIGLGFSLVDLKTEPVDAGVSVTGAIINGTSLDHHDAAFTVSLGQGRQTKVVIPELAAGHSAPFEAVVGPATEKDVPEKIRILFAGSTVSYY
jgi:hypothetical protein